jgi:hypothetical protein
VNLQSINNSLVTLTSWMPVRCYGLKKLTSYIKQINLITHLHNECDEKNINLNILPDRYHPTHFKFLVFAHLKIVSC